MPIDLPGRPVVEGFYYRWLQLAMGVVCMAMIANLQYGWALFVDPIDAKFHWGRVAIQTASTLFAVTVTWLVPVEAWFVDKYGPSVVIFFGGVVIAIAWVLNSHADTLVLLYLAAIIAGIGAGAVYGTCVGNALKWFPIAVGTTRGRLRRRCGDHRGPDRQHDRGDWLPVGVLYVRHRTRRDRLPAGIFPAQAVAGDAGETETAQSAADQDRLHPAAGAAQPDLTCAMPATPFDTSGKSAAAIQGPDSLRRAGIRFTSPRVFAGVKGVGGVPLWCGFRT